MSVIIRLQNLPWAASANDIRRYFEGLKIPEGGVHIVGGELGDVFIAFSTDEDARQAMLRDGGKIHEMQIKLFLSSRSEMTNVIEKTRQQSQYLPLQQQPAMPIKHSLMHPAVPVQHQSNMPAMVSVQQPIVSHSQQSGITVAASVENDRKLSPGSSLHRLTEKSPIRDRNYSPDPRRDMRRDRSRSPIRRVGSDVDRRNDRFGRDDRVYDENAQYRENRQLLKADSARHNNDDMNRRGVYRQTASHNYYESPTNDNLPINLKNIDWSNAAFALNNNREKQNSLSALNSSSANSFVQQSREAYMPFTTESYEQMPSSNKEQMSNQVAEREKRQMRFNDRYPSTRGPAPFPRSSQVSSKIMDETAKDGSFNDKKFQDVSHLTGPKPSDEQPENSQWAKKRQGLLKPPVRKDSSWKNNQYGTPDQIKPGSGRYEEFSRRGPPVHNDNHWQEPPPIAVEIKGVPPDVIMSEILGLFQNVNIPATNICIKGNNQGTEKFFVRFNHPNECKQVLGEQPYYIRNYLCQVSACPLEAFEAAASASKPRMKIIPKEEDLVLQLRGLPFSCSENNVEQFFKGLRIVDMHLEKSPDGKCSGVGFVQFSSMNDYRVALTLNGKMIGHRYITISVASKESLAVARGSNYPPQKPRSPPHASGPPHGFPPRPKGRNEFPPGNLGNGPLAPKRRPPTNFSISLRGLPDRVTNDDIANFFRDTGINIRAFHIMLNADKLPNGDAFIEVPNKRDADAALRKNGEVMRGMHVSVTPIAFEKMSEILHGPVAILPPPPPMALLQTPPDQERPLRRPLLPQVPDRERFENSPDLLPSERMDFDPPNNQPRFDGPYPPRGPDFPQGIRPRPGFPRGERPRMEGPYPGGRPPMERPMRPPHGRMRGPFPNRPPFNGPPAQTSDPVCFGAPGCVVSVNNLHFRATLENVLEFFKDYKLSKDSVIRRFNENKQVTGEARVAFQSPRDAQKAVRELNHKSIMGRSLSLALL